MLTQTIRSSVPGLVLCAIVGIAAPADAQISHAGGAGLPWASRWDAAYDSVNRIYLLLADGHPPSRVPVRGQFADANGNAIGGMFNITDEFADTGEAPSWATVTFGGTPDDPTFLITYLVPLEGRAIPKYGRLVRYRAGSAPLVSARTKIFPDVGGEWFAADRARPAWNGSRFIVPTRVPGGAVGSAYAQPYFTFFDLTGASWGGINLGTSLDYQGGPSVACSAANVCMAAGFAAGAPYGSVGGIWARLFDGSTLQPISEVFYPDDHSTFMDTPHVVFNASTGQFNLIWYRRVAGTGAIDFRVINTNGTMGPLDLTRSFTVFPGEPGLSYNPVSKTSLLLTKWGSGADLYSLELGDDGYPRNLGNAVLITAWDGKVLEYRPAVISNLHSARWLVTYNLATSSGMALVAGNGTGGGGGGGGSCNYSTNDSQATIGGGTFTGLVTVTATAGCAWTAGTQASWLSVATTSGSGSGSVQWTAQPNTSGAGRAGTIVIAGRQLSVYQAPLLFQRFADFNADSYPDIIWQNHSTGQLAVWRMNGFQFSSGESLSPGVVADTGWKVVAAIDIDRNGSTDLLWQHDQGWVAVWRMQGESMISGELITQSPLSDLGWRIVGTGDFDRDGWTDFLWQHTDGSVAVWFMQGTQFRSGAVIAQPLSDQGWRVVGSADMNGDNYNDLVWGHKTTGQVAIWLMHGTQLADAFLVNESTPNTFWQIRGLGDFDGDADVDILWQNLSTGALAAWVMRGVSVDHGLMFNQSVPDTNWKIVAPR